RFGRAGPLANHGKGPTRGSERNGFPSRFGLLRPRGGAADTIERTRCIVKSRISGKDATYVARESDKRRPIRLLAPEGVEEPLGAFVPSEGAEQVRNAPPRVLKPSALNDQCVAPTPDLESHRKRLREAFGNTMSDEFAEVLLGKLLEALRPAALESLEQPT